MVKLSLLWSFLLLLHLTAAEQQLPENEPSFKEEVVEVLRDQVIKEAAWALQQEPVTVTATLASRSAGGKHDFYSEGDYWWPDPENPGGPYIRKDGKTNPDNFVAHRLAMIRFSRIIGSLASAYSISGDSRYVHQAARHLKAWFVLPETRMNPSLEFAQAIHGRVSGRGIGIIDTIHLMEVAQGVRAMEGAPGLDEALVAGVKEWFRKYLKWLTTHPYGKAEMNWKNNHATCWAMQVASFARLTEDEELLDFCRKRYKEVLLPRQMAEDGSFPLELERTKPYGYSLFNLDAMTTLVHLLSDEKHDLWRYQTSSGKSIKKGIAFMYPYVIHKASWPFEPDVMYWEQWPVAHPFLLLGAERFHRKDWFAAWKKLEHAPQLQEVIRNLPLRHPIIWL